jgi:phage tail-like protein
MSLIKNPRKKFNFRITILTNPVLPVFAAQQVTSPDIEVEAVEHGFGNTVLKTAGLVKVGTLKIDRIISMAPGDGQSFYRWQMNAQDGMHQTGGAPEDYKQVVKVEEYVQYGSGNPEVIDTYYAIGAWPQKINGREYDRTASENVVESIELAVDYLSLTPPGNA